VEKRNLLIKQLSLQQNKTQRYWETLLYSYSWSTDKLNNSGKKVRFKINTRSSQWMCSEN